jgi:hypothetical protein
LGGYNSRYAVFSALFSHRRNKLESSGTVCLVKDEGVRDMV